MGGGVMCALHLRSGLLPAPSCAGNRQAENSFGKAFSSPPKNSQVTITPSLAQRPEQLSEGAQNSWLLFCSHTGGESSLKGQNGLCLLPVPSLRANLLTFGVSAVNVANTLLSQLSVPMQKL